MPKWKDLKRYCDKTGWVMFKNTDHYYYRKVLDNGDVLRTKVSKGSGEIGNVLWKEILKKQLKTTQQEFNKNI